MFKPTIISIEVAAARGLKRFFTGIPCARGHLAERKLIGRHCVECHKENAKKSRSMCGSGSCIRNKNNGVISVKVVDQWPSLESLTSIFKIESQKDAILSGSKRFFTGLPCKHGHIDQRAVASGACLACATKQNTGSDEPRRMTLIRTVRAAKSVEPALPEWQRITRNDARAAGLKRYFDGTQCDEGHVAPRYVGNQECTTCSRVRNRDRYATDPEFRARRIAYETERNRRPDVRSARLVKASEYNRRPEVRMRLLERIKHDPLFKLQWNIRTLLRIALKKRKHKKQSRLQTILGCTIVEFKKHMERQFEAGMTWANHGEWEMDHIVAISKAQDGIGVEALFHHTNMRPLWKKPNRSKGAKMEYLI